MAGVTGRAGPTWERRCADHAAERGLPWDRAPLRGNRDLLDLSGTIPAGFLVGCKAITRKTGLARFLTDYHKKYRKQPSPGEIWEAGQKATFGAKISEAMQQGERALANLGRAADSGIIPVQVMQRSGYPVGQAYVVMHYDDFLELALERAKGRADQ